MSETIQPRELTPEEQEGIKALQDIMGIEGEVEWYFENEEWHPAWGPQMDKAELELTGYKD